MAEKKIKKWHLFILFVVIIIAIGLKFYQSSFSSVVIRLQEEELNVLVAKTIYQQHKGLGGRKSLGHYDGMIFPYGIPTKPTMVMRDMEFPIDIVWFLNGVVVDMAPNLPLETGVPEEQLKRYSPRQQANLVLELPAGWVVSNNLKIGDKISLVEE